MGKQWGIYLSEHNAPLLLLRAAAMVPAACRERESGQEDEGIKNKEALLRCRGAGEEALRARLVFFAS
jgi:hypothetical protein